MFLDTHCHLTHERYREDLPEVLVRAGDVGGDGGVSIAWDLVAALALGSLRAPVGWVWGGAPRLYATAGVHPHEARRAPADLHGALRELLRAAPGFVAIGECGLDFHYDHSPRSVQERVFDRHLAAAQDLGLPLVVHCREAEGAMIPRVREAGDAGITGVLHCFPGDPDLLDVALEAGWYVSFTGMVTFRSFEGADAVRAVPSGHYMLETDGPYMAPVPRRGERNEPAFLPLIRDRIAELRGVPPSEVERETGEAALRFFGLDRPGQAD